MVRSEKTRDHGAVSEEPLNQELGVVQPLTTLLVVSCSDNVVSCYISVFSCFKKNNGSFLKRTSKNPKNRFFSFCCFFRCFEEGVVQDVMLFQKKPKVLVWLFVSLFSCFKKNKVLFFLLFEEPQEPLFVQEEEGLFPREEWFVSDRNEPQEPLFVLFSCFKKNKVLFASSFGTRRTTRTVPRKTQSKKNKVLFADSFEEKQEEPQEPLFLFFSCFEEWFVSEEPLRKKHKALVSKKNTN